MQLAVTNPNLNQPPSQKEQVPTTSERILKVLILNGAIILIGICWIAVLAEVTTILAAQAPSSSISWLVLSILVLEGSASTAYLAVTPLFVFGALLIILGALL